MTTPFTPAEHFPARGAGIFDDQATGLPDWDCGEPGDWDSPDPADWEPADWDPAELADWEPEDPEGEPPKLATPYPEALVPGALDPGALDPEAWDPEALDAGARDLGASDQETERRSLACAEGGSRQALKAGPADQTRDNGGWFAAGGIADGLLPGPRLAGFMADAKAIGLTRLTDNELIGMMRAARRLASWSAAMELAAAGDLWRRRWAEEQAGNTGAACHAEDRKSVV